MSLLGKWFGFGSDEVFDEGMAAFDRGDYEEAVEALDNCLESSSDPDDLRLARFYLAQAHSELGREFLRADKPALAREQFESALKLFPSYPDLNVAAARANRALGDIGQSCMHLDRALATNPRHAEAIMVQAICWYEAGREDEALARANYACQLDGGLSLERYQRALECHAARQRSNVVSHLEAMAAHASIDAQLHARVGDSFLRDRRFTDAASEYGKAVQLSPDFAEAHCKLGKALLELGDSSVAAEHLERALSINPCYAEAHAILGVAYEQMRRNHEAEGEFAEALKLHPGHPVALKHLKPRHGYVA